jgi:hypothetical protein
MPVDAAYWAAKKRAQRWRKRHLSHFEYAQDRHAIRQNAGRKSWETCPVRNTHRPTTVPLKETA